MLSKKYPMRHIILFTFLILFKVIAHAQTPEQILTEKGITLPELPKALGNYTSFVRSGNMIYLSGRGPFQADGKYIIGKLGRDLDTKQGYAAARLCGIAQLAVLKKELGDLSKVKKIVKVTGFVNCTEIFMDQPKVIDGYSDLMGEIFGGKGIHARSAVGVASLPAGWPVEVEMVVEIEQ
jgi:enamine deaminase RidA (YjgF/YER057c/UK114 family)